MPYYKRNEKCKQKSGKTGSFVTIKKDGGERKCWKSKAAFDRSTAARHANESDDPLDETDVMALGGGEDEDVVEAILRIFIREKLLAEQTFRGTPQVSQDAAATKIKAAAVAALGADQVDRTTFTGKGARLHTLDFFKDTKPAKEKATKKIAATYASSLSSDIDGDGKPDVAYTPGDVNVTTDEIDRISRTYPVQVADWEDKVTGDDRKLNVVYASQAAGGARGGGYGYEAELVKNLGDINYTPETADVKNVDIFISYTDAQGDPQRAAVEAKKQNAKFGEPTVQYQFKPNRRFMGPKGARSPKNTEATVALLNTRKARNILSKWLDEIRSAYLAAVPIYNKENPGEELPVAMTSFTRFPVEVYDIMIKNRGAKPFTTTKSVPSDTQAITNYYVNKGAHYIQIKGKGLYIFNSANDPLGFAQSSILPALPVFQEALGDAKAEVKVSIMTSSGKVIRAAGSLNLKGIPASSFSLDNADDVAKLAGWIGEMHGEQEPEPQVVSLNAGAGIYQYAASQVQLTEARCYAQSQLDLLKTQRYAREQMQLLKEDLTGADKSEIKRMIKKEIEGASNRRETEKIFKKKFDTELRKALGVSFFGNPGKINKFVVDQIYDEVNKWLADTATRNEIAEITKQVLVKLYRELSFSSPVIINRIKV